MNKSLAARQEALQQQNQELNEQVEAIEQRRQQLTNTSRPSSSSTSLHSASHLPIYKADSTANDDERNNPKSNLEIELSASIDSLSSQEITEACRSFAKSDKKDPSTNLRTTAARRSERKKPQSRSRMPPEDALPSRGNEHVSPSDESDPKGLSLEATVRYQKARLHVLQHEADAATDQAQQLQATQVVLKTEIENLKTQNSTLLKKNQQTQQLFEKHRELSAAQEEKERILEGQLASAQARVEETLRAEKLASQQFRSKDVRLNRALEEIEKLKAQLQDEKKNHGEKMVSKAEYDHIVQDNKKLDKQKGELLVAFKKQMKLIDLLKRQRVHMEVAKMLSFTEAEFSKTLELG